MQPMLIECWQGSADRYCRSSLSHLIRNPWLMNLIKAHLDLVADLQGISQTDNYMKGFLRVSMNML